MINIWVFGVDFMNHEDYELYNLLNKLKDLLQHYFYDHANGRKPAICSDESLRLLAKYKPTTLEDMANISGIGDGFIENYGKYFLREIKRFKSVDGIEISDNEKIILSKLENRLVHINKRNRLLYSGKVNKDYGIDLFKLINNVLDLEKFLLSRDTKQFKIMDIKEFDDEKLKALLKLIRQTAKIETESGNNELYIAYPFVQGKMETENFNVKAPLMLFPVKIERSPETIVLKNDYSRDIIYNTNLILANNKFNGKNEVLPDNSIEEFNEENYINDMINFYNENKFYIQYKDCELERFLENKVSEFPNYKNGELEVKKYMVLGLYSTYVTSMYEDFHKMIQDNDVTKLIKELLCGMESIENKVDVSYDESLEKTQVIEPIENEINYINELDFSQENVLKEMNNSDSIVVQGPPGTGKSQTITSIIAQSILKGHKVLMVSEKKTALDVIYSRLGDLSKFAIIIDDIENKTIFYEQINSIINTLNTNHRLLYKSNESKNKIVDDIKEKINNINHNLECLELIAKSVYGINDFNTSMFNVYNTCKRFDLNNQKQLSDYSYVNSVLTEDINKFQFQLLTRVKDMCNEADVSSCLDNYLNIVREHSFLNNIKQNLVDIEIIELIKKLNDLEVFLNEYNKLPFYKKLFERSKLKLKISEIISLYFVVNNSDIFKYVESNASYIREFLGKYQEFVSNKYLYDKLNFAEKDYVNLIGKVKFNLNISFKEANDLIYNTVLFNVINDFEKNNSNVMYYINNFDNIRSDIRKNIVDKKELTKKLAFNELLGDIYNLDGNNKLSKIEEMCNRKRKMSINKFMGKYKLEIMDSIKIWLMTPEVVSDILPFEKNLFDLVIFDEASQLYVEKSIPAIYRAKKVVVAGDQKQLKPSSLGQGRILDEIDEDEISDGFLEYESLLDASRYKYKHTMLNYHYRAKYEELISFSNYAFYNGKLMVTSLARDEGVKPIERIKVENGMWIDKKNEQEANEVVRLVKHILNTRKNNETIGVITFNSSQMNLIEDLIEKEKMLDSNFAMQMLAEESRFSNGENISFFVKNIETVQGDERDIIIFCIGYARNEMGRVAINFGWLNQDGGENRLNVAISRAKEKIYVVTSIEPHDLVVDSTKNDGPKLFKLYLEYVKAIDAGDNQLARSILLSLLDRNDEEQQQLTFDSDFEEEVCQKLIEQGYDIETQYGVGGYRIDIVIKNKDGSNLLGIECDGRLYHCSKFARERDYHRQKYLESRGWNIYRIWSTNWWKNPDLEIKKINDYIAKVNNKTSVF